MCIEMHLGRPTRSQRQKRSHVLQSHTVSVLSLSICTVVTMVRLPCPSCRLDHWALSTLGYNRPSAAALDLLVPAESALLDVSPCPLVGVRLLSARGLQYQGCSTQRIVLYCIFFLFQWLFVRMLSHITDIKYPWYCTFLQRRRTLYSAMAEQPGPSQVKPPQDLISYQLPFVMQRFRGASKQS